MLTPEEKKSIIDYRRQKAYDNLNEAKEVAKLHFWINPTDVCFPDCMSCVSRVIMTTFMMRPKRKSSLISKRQKLLLGKWKS